ncbi:LAFA_0B02806g1_1 [Lachancea sp. 'fantastica']|nr:LAFA_0B02806g1_1 [Lachancea sp. 'fantastica']
MILSIIYAITSAAVTTFFLTVLFLFSLWHNLVAAHFNPRDPRDTRSSKSEIKPKKRTRNSSTASGTPLALDNDRLDNIKFDHLITSPQTNSEASDDAQWDHNKHDNPFGDLLYAEDLKLVPDLKHYYTQYGISIEEHEIETQDGFILDLWHFTPADDRTVSGSKKQPMLLLHGLLQSSGSFASAGRKSLAYYFYESGFDVWLGNNRCGFKPKWNQAKVKSDAKWNWDMKDLVKYDLRALVTAVLEKTGRSKLTLVAHSQGTTQGLMGLANGETLYEDDFRLVDKLENFVALAPAMYPGPLLQEKLFVRFMSRFIATPFFFGKRSFMPQMMLMRSLMVGTKLFSFLSYVMFNYLFDWNDTLWDKSLRDRHFLFSPVNISVKLMEWWLSQDMRKKTFKTYGNDIFPDAKTWFPTESDLSIKKLPCHTNAKMSTIDQYPRILLFVPKQDRLVDGERLINHFADFESQELYKCWYIDEYSHLDVLWAHDVISRIGRPVLDNIRVTDDAM